jgi:hypothetical protein
MIRTNRFVETSVTFGADAIANESNFVTITTGPDSLSDPIGVG